MVFQFEIICPGDIIFIFNVYIIGVEGPRYLAHDRLHVAQDPFAEGGRFRIRPYGSGLRLFFLILRQFLGSDVLVIDPGQLLRLGFRLGLLRLGFRLGLFCLRFRSGFFCLRFRLGFFRLRPGLRLGLFFLCLRLCHYLSYYSIHRELLRLVYFQDRLPLLGIRHRCPAHQPGLRLFRIGLFLIRDVIDIQEVSLHLHIPEGELHRFFRLHMDIPSCFFQIEPDVQGRGLLRLHRFFTVRVNRVGQFLQDLCCPLRILSVFSQVHLLHGSTDPFRESALRRLHRQKDPILREDIPEDDCRVSGFFAFRFCFFRFLPFLRLWSPGIRDGRLRLTRRVRWPLGFRCCCLRFRSHSCRCLGRRCLSRCCLRGRRLRRRRLRGRRLFLWGFRYRLCRGFRHRLCHCLFRTDRHRGVQDRCARHH